MDEPIVTVPPDGGNGTPDGTPKPDANGLEFYKSELQKVIKQRDEAKEKIRLEDENRLKEQNKYKELYETKEQELARLTDEKKQLETYKTKFEEFETAQRATLKTAFGDKWKPSFDTLDISVLRDLAETSLGDKYLYTPPKSGGGQGAKKDPKDMSEAEYIAYRNAGGKI